MGTQERGLNWGSIRAPDELVDEGHLNDRGFWVEVPFARYKDRVERTAVADMFHAVKAYYPDRAIYGIDLDSARVAAARATLASATIIVGDCDEGWPFPGVDDTFALCDADAYAYPYGAIRAFWKHARKADAVGLLGTDAQMQQYMLSGRFRHPDGHSVHNVIMKDRSRTWATYWVRLIKPWLAALVAPDGYSITMTKHFDRVRMHYWGAVAKR